MGAVAAIENFENTTMSYHTTYKYPKTVMEYAKALWEHQAAGHDVATYNLGDGEYAFAIETDTRNTTVYRFCQPYEERY